MDMIDFLLSLVFSFSNSIGMFHKPVSTSLSPMIVVSPHVTMALVRCSWHVHPSSVNCGTKIKLFFMSGMTDAVLALSDNGRFMLIFFVAVESMVDVFAQLTRIGLCLINSPGHSSLTKWLVALVAHYPVIGYRKSNSFG